MSKLQNFQLTNAMCLSDLEKPNIVRTDATLNSICTKLDLGPLLLHQNHHNFSQKYSQNPLFFSMDLLIP